MQNYSDAFKSNFDYYQREALKKVPEYPVFSTRYHP
jgi:hypothetical protein